MSRVLARPGGNLTGVKFLNIELAAKQLGLLRELVPAATRVAALINPANSAIVETTLRELELAAHAMGVQVQIFRASTSREIDAASATFVRERPDALFVGAIPSSTLGVFSCPFWQCATQSPPYIWDVNMLRPAG